MRRKEVAQTVTLTSPAAASTVVGATQFKGGVFLGAEKLVVDATLVGGTGGTLDVYLQRKIGTNAWLDFVHFPQITAGTTKHYTVTITGEGATSATITEVGSGTDATPGVALAANTVVNVIPGGDVRIVFVAGTGTSAGGVNNSITITPYYERH